MKKNKIKDSFLEQLRKIPIVQVACEKVNISRNSVYRWRNEDKEFEKEMELALLEGEALVNDLTENQLLSLIKDKEWPAIRFWLDRRNPKFKEKVETTVRIENQNVPLDPEQEALMKKALSLAMPPKANDKS
jgi:hypothetical protein